MAFSVGMHLLARDTGIRSARELSEQGISRHRLAHAVTSGSLVRVARGWYATPTHDVDVAAALRASSRLTCVSALARHGVWVLHHRGTHVRVCRSDARRLPPPLVAHRAPERTLGHEAVDDIETALRCAFRCLPPVEALIVADSVVNKRLLSRHEVEQLATHATRPNARALRYLDGRSQSGTETIVRYNLQSRRYRVTPQFSVRPGEFHDLLVGDRLIIECDSRGHHTGIREGTVSAAMPELAHVRDSHYEIDRQRDLASSCDGYVTVRLSYWMTVVDWEHTWSQLERLLRAGVHRQRAVGRRLMFQGGASRRLQLVHAAR